jgi:hypothetical protein
VTGLQVHITSQGTVIQGVPEKIRGEKKQHLKKSFTHRLQDFPSTDSIMENGFNHASNWADLDNTANFKTTSSPEKMRGNRTGLKLELPGDPLGDSSAHPNRKENFPSPIIDDDVDGDKFRPTTTTATTDGGKTSNLAGRTHLSSRGAGRPEPSRPTLTDRAKSPTTMMWQVATGTEIGKGGGGGLVTVNRTKVPKNVKQVKGITTEFFPEEWQDSRYANGKRDFAIHKGVTVATRKI